MKKGLVLTLAVLLILSMMPLYSYAGGLNINFAGSGKATNGNATTATEETAEPEQAPVQETEAAPVQETEAAPVQETEPAAVQETEPAAEEGSKEFTPAEIADAILLLLENQTYNDTYAALKGGEVVKFGDYTTTAAGVQQTFVDLGCDIAVDGSAGQNTLDALHKIQQVLGMEQTDVVDAALYEQLLPYVYMTAEPEMAYDLLSVQYSSEEGSGELEYKFGCAYFLKGNYYRAKEYFDSCGYGNWEEYSALCVQDFPATGEIWHNPNFYSNDVHQIFTVNSYDENEGMYFEIYYEDGTLVSCLFVNGSDSAATWIPSGAYRIKDATGTEWYGVKDAFGRYGSYEFMEFYEYDDDIYKTWMEYGYEYTISINVSTATEGSGVGATYSDWDEWTAD